MPIDLLETQAEHKKRDFRGSSDCGECVDGRCMQRSRERDEGDAGEGDASPAIVRVDMRSPIKMRPKANVKNGTTGRISLGEERAVLFHLNSAARACRMWGRLVFPNALDGLTRLLDDPHVKIEFEPL